jgi:hypothetical protein
MPWPMPLLLLPPMPPVLPLPAGGEVEAGMWGVVDGVTGAVMVVAGFTLAAAVEGACAGRVVIVAGLVVLMAVPPLWEEDCERLVPAAEGMPAPWVPVARPGPAPDTRKGCATVIILAPDCGVRVPDAEPEAVRFRPSLTTGRETASAWVPQPLVRIQEAVPTTSRARTARERGSTKALIVFIASLL